MSDRILCRLDDIPDGGARGFPPAPGGFTGLFAIRRGDAVQVYVNACPHLGLPLEPVPHRFLDGARRHVVCCAHGARFRVEDGFCVSGPCAGESLETVPARIEGDSVVVPADAGR
ncbi:Rieske (2Fe-2S) protein [Roseomonas sp. CCTCC AB2023176]|uniref:Rieske (2Fe-2S) protein n=1 Tax=Roseomonas sp. CCTCC AB2023176 TaxID=3342640 RepID=UPI0035DAC6BF